MKLVINLQDHEGKSHKNVKFVFQDQAIMEEFQEEICSTFEIKMKDQELFHSGRRIDFQFSLNSTLSEIGLKDMDTVIVKHSRLDQWEIYVNEVNDFKKTQQINVKRSMAVTAQECYDILRTSSFFVTYREFESKASNLHPPIAKFLDKNTSPIMNAATHFFKLKVFDGKNPDVEFEDVDLDEGSRAAVICNVKIDSDVFRYRIKTNHNAGQSTQVSPWNLDLIELFCYKFLERIKVGPKILFVPNCVSSECIIYIASEWIPTFRNFKGLNRSNVLQSESNRWRRALVQIYFLTVFLSLGSMHDENFGIDNNLNPIIVDFSVFNFDNPKEEFLNFPSRMDLFIYLHDHEGISRRELALNLDDQTTLDQFKEMISSDLGIERKMQELFFSDGRKIFGFASSSTLSEIGLKHMDKVIVKHSDLGRWDLYLVVIENFEKAADYLKKKKALDALKILNILDKSNFFLCYPNLRRVKERQHFLIACYEDLVDSKIEEAVKAYFNRIYAADNPSSPPLNFTFMPKPQKGLQGGCICKVTTEGGIITFYVKSHCEKTSRSMGPIDLRELFVYLLLFSINVGPEVHFVLNKHGSKLELYIITKEVPGFMIASETNIGTKQMAQRKLLENILYLVDLHEYNYGLDCNGCLSIINFQVCLHKYDSKVIVSNFQEGFKTNGMEVAKESFQTWDLLNKMDEVNRRIKELKLKYSDLSYMEKYEEYYNLILTNVHCFIDVVNSK